jgi:ABC-2 type transport system permease protein
MHALGRVVAKEFFQLRRDRKMIPVMVVGPVVQLLALGYAANVDVTRVATVLVDQDRTPESRRAAARFTSSGHFELVGAADSPEAAEPWLVEGRAALALVLGPGLGEALAGGGSARLQLLADGTDANSAGVGMAHAARLVASWSREEGERRLAAKGARPGGIDLVPRVFYNPDLRSRWFYVPAVLAMVLMLVTMMLPSMAIVREKELGTLEQLIVTPLRPWQLVLGKLLPFLAIGLVDTLLITGLARAVFGVPVRGSLLVLLLLTFLYLLCTLGLGLLVSTLTSTQQQAMLFSAFVLMVPMIYLSGVIFPIENMPAGFQAFSRLIPVRYYANVLRGVFLKGSGLSVLWTDAAALAAMGLVILALASARFRKRLD